MAYSVTAFSAAAAAVARLRLISFALQPAAALPAGARLVQFATLALLPVRRDQLAQLVSSEWLRRPALSAAFAAPTHVSIASPPPHKD
eukprot:CAMPEP_0171121492 /NCGR_PEP_ID=MMETSP0766_2-20121228/102652_1 /TAXON_ID=439317 /ORGANISM="Gambierdiscus australes, Strain CAWD 149" /LENGTH=87 /DNA_ID=CAMNT_0011584277 /DNA_START=181 /DNA_END=445 /DNA_ORIENTATION=+